MYTWLTSDYLIISNVEASEHLKSWSAPPVWTASNKMTFHIISFPL